MQAKHDVFIKAGTQNCGEIINLYEKTTNMSFFFFVFLIQEERNKHEAKEEECDRIRKTHLGQDWSLESRKKHLNTILYKKNSVCKIKYYT